MLYEIYDLLPDSIKNRWRLLKEMFIERNLAVGKFYDSGMMEKMIDRKIYYSQYGQDFFLDKFVFAGKKKGFFVDVGANHPIKLSNTYYFEKIGWEGLAFEPQIEMYKKWNVRDTKCYNVALGSTNTTVKMAKLKDDNDESVMSGVADILNCEDVAEFFEVKQRRLGDVLKENGIKNIDFVSIDVEGYEMEVLKGIDFDDVNINCFVIENNKKKGGFNQRIRDFMDAQGYEFQGRIFIDDVYIYRANSEFDHPVTII